MGWRDGAASSRLPPCASGWGRGYRSRWRGRIDQQEHFQENARPREGGGGIRFSVRKCDNAKMHVWERRSPGKTRSWNDEVLERRGLGNMDANWICFHPNPSKPRFKAPPGAVDAHCHVFGPQSKFPYAPERKYTPCDAPKEKLFALRDHLGFDRNVIVQASCHGKDNAALVDALESSNNKAKGVAFVGDEVTDAELKSMDRAGVKGVRSTSASGWGPSPRPKFWKGSPPPVPPPAWHSRAISE